MSVIHRRTGIAAAVLACLPVAYFAVCRTPSARAEQANPIVAGRAAMNEPVRVPQPKMYTARFVLQVPLSARQTGGVDLDQAAAQNLVSYVLSSETTYFSRNNQRPTKDQPFSIAGRVNSDLQFVGGSIFVTVESYAPDRSAALQVASRAELGLVEVFNKLYDANFLSAKGELPLGQPQLDDLRKNCEAQTKALLTLFAPFGSYSDASIALDSVLTKKKNCDKELEDIKMKLRDTEMELAVQKAVTDSLEQRLAKEAEAAQKAEKEDPIARELQAVVELAERAYAAAEQQAANGVTPADEVLQKKKALADSRLALLQRREELSTRMAGPEFARWKEDLMNRELSIVITEAQRRSWLNRVAQLEPEIARLTEALEEAQPLRDEIKDLTLKLERQKQLGRVPETQVLLDPSLVAE